MEHKVVRTLQEEGIEELTELLNHGWRVICAVPITQAVGTYRGGGVEYILAQQVVIVEQGGENQNSTADHG